MERDIKPYIYIILIPMKKTDFSSLSRSIHPMPDFVLKALNDQGLLSAYQQRPPYQQNDYVGWIDRAKRFETKQRRLDQMLDELERGDLHMRMGYKPRPTRE